MCLQCVQGNVDLTTEIPKQYSLPQCPNCDRFEISGGGGTASGSGVGTSSSGGHFAKMELESRELLGVCLKRMHRLNKVARLVDAGWIFTEPHSKRIKIKLTVQNEVFSGAMMQQTFVVEFVITSQQCVDCQKSFTQHVWNRNDMPSV